MTGDGLAGHALVDRERAGGRAPAGATSGAGGAAPTADPSMGPNPQTWPITVEQFLAGPYLEPADILLMRRRGSTFARLVRIFTGSFFSKVALVFLVPHREQDFDATFTVEAAFSGIDLTDLASFLNAKEGTYVVAVKRYERSWFELEERNLVRGYMLSHIKAGYDYGRLFDNWWAALDRSGFVVLRLLLGPQWAVRQLFKLRGGKKLTKFIGPGFVQWGYYETVKELIAQGALTPSALEDVTFREELLDELAKGKISQIDEDDILGVTAEDFARSPRLAWKYAILDGKVYEITTDQQFYDCVKASGQRYRDLLRRRRRETSAEVAGS